MTDLPYTIIYTFSFASIKGLFLINKLSDQYFGRKGKLIITVIWKNVIKGFLLTWVSDFVPHKF